MTLPDISIKMLLANVRRYRLYFLCNVFSIALFYCFTAILSNKAFMDPKSVDSMISSNIYAPTVFVAIFLVLFIPYSYHAFLRNRKHEYGILMTLGMSESEVLANMVLENCIIAVISLAGGLLLGTAASFVFYFIIQHVIGVSDLHWYFNWDSYWWTAALYGVTILVTLATGVYGLLKAQITDLLKDKFRGEKKGKGPGTGILLAGFSLSAVSVLCMLIGYVNGKQDQWFAISLAILFVGLWLIMAHTEGMGKYMAKILPRSFHRHVVASAFISQHGKSRSRIAMIAAWLIGFSLFFSGFCMVMYPGITQKAITYSPYDMVFSQIFKMNQAEDRKIESVLNQNHVTVKAIDQVGYLRSKSFNVLAVSDVNNKFGCRYQVPEGKFMTVFQEDLNDGYKHDLTTPKRIGFNCDAEVLELQPAGSDIRILFNDNPTFADMTLIVSDGDYHKIATKSKDVWAGVIKLYSFADWKDSGKGIAAVQQLLLEQNKIEPSEQQRYYRATSRIDAYTTAKQSAEFLMFILFFIMALFTVASNVMIHFKIKAEAEEEQRLLSCLYRIGVTEAEMLAMIRHKNFYYFMPQVFAGLLIGVFYGYTANAFYGYGWKAALCSLLAGLVFMALQFVVTRRYSSRELRSFDI